MQLLFKIPIFSRTKNHTTSPHFHDLKVVETVPSSSTYLFDDELERNTFFCSLKFWLFKKKALSKRLITVYPHDGYGLWSGAGAVAYIFGDICLGPFCFQLSHKLSLLQLQFLRQRRVPKPHRHPPPSTVTGDCIFGFRSIFLEDQYIWRSRKKEE